MTPLIFFGSDQYSAIVLDQLITHGKWSMINVVTDKQKEPSSVEKLAKEYNLPVSYYPTLPSTIGHRPLTIGLCASFDHLIPTAIIQKFDGQLYNLHPSLLPQYRNVSPVQYAIALGDKETGITLFRISSGIDDGEIVAQISEPILPTDTTPTLTSRLFSLGAELFLSFLDNPTQIPTHHTEARQSEGWIFTHRLTRDSGYIEWSILHRLLQNQPVSPSDTKNELLFLRLSRSQTVDHHPLTILHALVRALTPWPTVWSLVPSNKGELRITLETVTPEIKLKIAGKPNAISYSDFNKYYLEK